MSEAQMIRFPFRGIKTTRRSHFICFEHDELNFAADYQKLNLIALCALNLDPQTFCVFVKMNFGPKQRTANTTRNIN